MLDNDQSLRFGYESTGELTRFTDDADPKPRSRPVFAFLKPETMQTMLAEDKTLRERLHDIPSLDPTGLRDCQFTAINQLEASFRDAKPRALVQMATGEGKTFTAITSIYRLLKFAKVRKILFLVDTRNLGKQAEQEFMAFEPTDDNRKFTDLYKVQRLTSRFIAPDAHVCISTIQRMYSILKGEDLDASDEETNPAERTLPKEPMPVVYNPTVPLELFDVVIIDECHRSIYNLWKQVLEYFDAFQVGLTATPDKRTFGYFHENVVSEYPYEQSVVDGVNVGFDIFRILTEVTANGGVITKATEDPKGILAELRNQYNPRIAVTVDMIATGTDVKPLECLIFMRDVRSRNYFEQMKGRGCRSVQLDDLKKVGSVSQDSSMGKGSFILVDAVGVTYSHKTDSRPLERKRTVPMKDLLHAIALGKNDEDVFISAAGRLARLHTQLKPEQHKELEQITSGKSLSCLCANLLAAHDADAIEDQARLANGLAPEAEPTEAQKASAQKELVRQAAQSLTPQVRDFVENARKALEQIVDNQNLDRVLAAEWDQESVANAESVIADFTAYLAAHKDEIIALRIFYDQPYRLRELTYDRVRQVLDRLLSDKPALAPVRVWNAYAQLENNPSLATPKQELVALVSLLRRVVGLDNKLTNFDALVRQRFQDWVFKRHAGDAPKFTEEQMNWLQMIRDHIATSFHVDKDDLELTPFDALGGLGKFYQLFGQGYQTLLDDLNEGLVA